MKVREIFEASFNDKMRGWENKNEYPSSWDDAEFEPEEHGYVSFEDAWQTINKAVRQNQGAALVNVANEQGTTPQKVYQELRRSAKYAVSENGGDAEDLMYKEDEVTRVVQAITKAASGDANAQAFVTAVASMEEPYSYENVADDFAQGRGDFEPDVDAPDGYDDGDYRY